MSRGISNFHWMMKAAIYRVPQNYLVKSIADLIDWLDEEDYRNPLDRFEVMDRLVQVATTGEYKAPALDIYSQYEDKSQEDVPLTEEQQKIVDDFKDQMRDVFGNDDNNNEEENN